MRVALDVHALQVPGYADRGIGRYVAGYARALNRRRAVAAALLAPELPPAAGLPGELVSAGLVRWDCRATCSDVLSQVGPPVAYHVTAPFLHCGPGEPAGLGVVEHWAASGVPRVVLLHDLIPLRAPRHYLPAPTLEERYRARARWVGDADLIVTNSEYTRYEALELLDADPASVVTVGAGVSPYFSIPDGTDQELWSHHTRALGGRPYVLTVGGSDVRKGTDRAIAAVAQVVRRGVDIALMVAGHLTDQWRSDLETAARAAGIADRVLFLGAVDDELLRACYRRAELTVMPSLAEGAGLPVLESAACGTPAVASAGTALSEAAATPEALFDPADTDSVAEVMAATLQDPARRARMLAAQQALAAASSWDAVAGRALEAMARLAGRRGREGWSAPPRLALVGSRHDGEGPMLAAVAGLLGASGRAQVAVVGEAGGEVGHGGPGRARPAPAPPGTEQLSLGAFGLDVRPASFDHVVYRVGPRSLGELAGLARHHPGWLWVQPGVAPRDVAALAPCSRGFLVESAAGARSLSWRMAPGRPHPPIAVVPGPAAGEEAAVGLMEAVAGPAPAANH